MLTAAQIELRKTGLGASESCGALGVSRYSSPFAVWGRKVGVLPAFAGNWDTARGTAMEPALLDWYAETTGQSLSYPGTLRHPSIACILATPDAMAHKAAVPRCVECKDVKGRMARFWGEPGTDDVDPEYLPQAVQQMAVTGLERVDFVVSIGGEEPLIYSVLRRPSLEAKMMGRLARWWDRHVIGREPPKLDGSEEVRDWLDEQYPKADGVMLEASDDFEAMALERRGIVESVAKQTARKEEIENLTKAIIADALGIEGSFGKATWRRSRKTGRRPLRYTYATGTDCANEE